MLRQFLHSSMKNITHALDDCQVLVPECGWSSEYIWVNTYVRYISYIH
jgi:hypothetical protein